MTLTIEAHICRICNEETAHAITVIGLDTDRREWPLSARLLHAPLVKHTCEKCGSYLLYISDAPDHSWRQLYPDPYVHPETHPNLTPEMRNDYLEAFLIMKSSPRGAAALSGIILWHLQIECGASTGGLLDNIDQLISLKKLSPSNKMKMECIITVRDSAVHVNETDIKHNPSKVRQSFRFLNELAEDMLKPPDKTDPEIAKVLPHYMSLPKKRRDYIERRTPKPKP